MVNLVVWSSDGVHFLVIKQYGVQSRHPWLTMEKRMPLELANIHARKDIHLVCRQENDLNTTRSFRLHSTRYGSNGKLAWMVKGLQRVQLMCCYLCMPMWLLTSECLNFHSSLECLLLKFEELVCLMSLQTTELSCAKEQCQTQADDIGITLEGVVFPQWWLWGSHCVTFTMQSTSQYRHQQLLYLLFSGK